MLVHGQNMSDPHGMARTDLDAGRRELAAHEHAVCTYDTLEELRAALAVFVHEGWERDELIVFVHSFASDDEAWTFLRRAVPEVKKDGDVGVVVVSVYESAFEGGSGRIDYEHVGRVVTGLIDRAREDGKSGTRVFVDASRQYFAGSRMREWFDFEEWLGVRLQSKMGLVCAYRREDVMREDVLPQVLRTHAYRFRAP